MPEENENIIPVEIPAPESKSPEILSDLPQASAGFGTLPNIAEDFGKVPEAKERSEHHTLTVKEVARKLEAAGVARTERSIINWCQPNRQGISRLDCYYDPNEHKYYLTPQSVETVIAEEIQRVKKATEPSASEPFEGTVTHVKHSAAAKAQVVDEGKIQELEREIMDLKIANRGKDYLIDQLKGERAGFFEKLLSANRTVGTLETKLMQIEVSNQGRL